MYNKVDGGQNRQWRIKFVLLSKKGLFKFGHKTR